MASSWKELTVTIKIIEMMRMMIIEMMMNMMMMMMMMTMMMMMMMTRCPEGSSASELSTYDECIENALKGRGQKLQVCHHHLSFLGKSEKGTENINISDAVHDRHLEEQ